MKFFLLINVKMPTIVGILTFMSGKIAFYAYLSLKKPNFLIFLYLWAFKISFSTELSMESFITSWPDEIILSLLYAFAIRGFLLVDIYKYFCQFKRKMHEDT